jgi:hypothetical protein
MPRTRSREGILAEHKRYREQCRKRIVPALTLSALLLAVALVLVFVSSASWWLVGGVFAFCALNTGMEVVGYLRHDRRLRDLTQGQSAPQQTP